MVKTIHLSPIIGHLSFFPKEKLVSKNDLLRYILVVIISNSVITPKNNIAKYFITIDSQNVSITL